MTKKKARPLRGGVQCALCRGSCKLPTYADHVKRCAKASPADRAYFRKVGDWPARVNNRGLSKLTAYVSTPLRQALKIEAAKRGVTLGELIAHVFEITRSTVHGVRKAAG